MLNTVKFVDRVVELDVLRSWCSSFRYVPMYIYGPEGCGKTRLLKEFMYRFNEFFGEDAIALYIDALGISSIDRALSTSRYIAYVKEVVQNIVEKSVGFGVGKVLAENIAKLLEHLVTRKRFENNYIFIAIDDVARAIGPDRVEWYIKYLYETCNRIYELYRPRAINIVVTTSEGLSRRLIARHRHAQIYLLWNLGRDAFKELFQQLSTPNNIDFDYIWRLFGGNPGKLLELAMFFSWNVNAMVKNYEVREVRFRELVRSIRAENLMDVLKKVAENISMIEEVADPRVEHVLKILEENNLILYKYWVKLDGSMFSNEDPELGIGRYYAWQIPMYREILAKILKEF